MGIDGGTKEWAWKDQIGATINKKGIIALGRKFYPTENEKECTELAKDYKSDEDGKSRIFSIAGRKFFICACYDSFGIKHKNLVNPGVDVILDLIHGFNPKGEGDSGETYFARHGLAGASNQWKCPTFAGAIFFRRKIPTGWPSGVYWNGGGTRFCNYKRITIEPTDEIRLKTNEGGILTRIFSLDSLP